MLFHDSFFFFFFELGFHNIDVDLIIFLVNLIYLFVCSFSVELFSNIIVFFFFFNNVETNNNSKLYY